MAWEEKRKSGLLALAMSRASLWKGNLGMRSSVFFCILAISLSATVPGRAALLFLLSLCLEVRVASLRAAFGSVGQDEVSSRVLGFTWSPVPDVALGYCRLDLGAGAWTLFPDCLVFIGKQQFN